MLWGDRRKTDSEAEILRSDWWAVNFYRILLLAVVLLVALVVATAIPMSRNSINSEKNVIFLKPWQYRVDDGDFRGVSLPYNESEPIESQITLKNRLPKELARGATILLRTSQQDAKVFVGGVEIYDSQRAEAGARMPSSAYHFVRLPVDGADKEITVVLTSPYERYAGMVNQIYMGSKASHIFFLFHENGVRFLTGLLIFSIGILILIVFFFARGDKSKVPIIYLGALFTCAGFWLLVESRLLQFFCPYPMALTNASFFALTLLPVFLGFYYYSTHGAYFKQIGKYSLMVVTIASLGLAAASCVWPELPLRLFPAYLVFFGLYVAALLVALLVEALHKRKIISLSVCGGFVFGIFCLIELVLYLRDIKNYNKSDLLTVGLLLFCVLIVVENIRNFAEVHQSAIKVNALTVLAYTDSLTGLKNRTAFLERMAEIDMDEERGVSLAMFDINNLKVVNDTLGHLVGDALLRHGAKAMRASLRQRDELYRIGGDEFAAIIHHAEELELKVLEDRMAGVLVRENQKPLSYHLSVAYGYATFSRAEGDKTLFDTLARADEKMYACKRIQKGLMQ